MGGVSAARNTGIDTARGDYIWFVDADDFIQPNCLSKLRETANRSNADIIYFGAYEFEDKLSLDEERQKNEGLLERTKIYNHHLWSTLFKRKIIYENGIRFCESMYYSEDSLFILEFGATLPRTTDVNSVMYYYRRNMQSATRNTSVEADEKRTKALRLYYSKKLEIITEMNKRNDWPDQSYKASYLMWNVRDLTSRATGLCKKERVELKRKLKESGLFPIFLYRKPRELFPNSYCISSSSIIGKVSEILMFYSTTRVGFTLATVYSGLIRKILKKRHKQL